MVLSIKSEKEFKSVLSENQVVIADFTASWCGPCRQIAPVFEKLSNHHSAAKFIKVDVDEVKSVAAAEGITAMPTFCSYINGNRFSIVKGADNVGLENLVKNTIGVADEIKRQDDAIRQKKEDAEKLANEPITLSDEELMLKSIKELKEMIKRRGWSHERCVEKADLVLCLRKKGQM